MKIALLTAALIVFGAPAFAQQESIRFQFYRQNTVEPFSTYTAPTGTFQCNQAQMAAPTTATFVPRWVTWDDEVNAGRSCVYDSQANNPTLFAFPIGGVFYVKAVRIVDSAESPLSEASNPFVLPPHTVRNVRLHGGGN